MIPAMCRVSHKPNEGQYGDCVRACIATILEVDTEKVPHFAHDDPDGVELARRVREFLAPSHTIYAVAYPGDYSGLLDYIGEQNPGSTYMLIGAVAGGGEHMVVCQGNHVAHNPAWYGCSLVGPGGAGYWIVWVVARV